MARLTRDVIVLSQGLRKRRGSSIGRHEVSPELWGRWVDEGVIVEGFTASSKGPGGVDAPPVPEDGLDDLTMEDLRMIATQRGLTGFSRLRKDDLVAFVRENT